MLFPQVSTAERLVSIPVPARDASDVFCVYRVRNFADDRMVAGAKGPSSG